MECFFRRDTRKGKASKKTSGEKTSPKGQNSTLPPHGKNTNSLRKRKRQPIPDTDEHPDGFIATDDDGDYSDDIEDFGNGLRRADAQESEPENDDWTFSMGAASHVKKPRRSGQKKTLALDKTVLDDEEIISLSSD